MINKRIAAIIAGTAIATSAMVSPTVAFAQDDTTLSPNGTGNGSEPVCETVTTTEAGTQTTEKFGWGRHPITFNEGASTIPAGFTVTVMNERLDGKPVEPDNGEGVKGNAWGVISWPAGTPAGDHTLVIAYDQERRNTRTMNFTVTVEETTKEVCEEPEEGSSDAAGSALLGLSALAGSALLSSGSSSAIPDGDGSSDLSSGSAGSSKPGTDNGDSKGDSKGDKTDGPATGPVATPDTKATGQGQQPATGPVAAHDPKAAAQAQAANAPAAKAAPAKTAPVAQQTAPAPTAQKQLANTGVQGTLIALAAGLAAIAAGALLVLRRRTI